jgi:hypothetical protein
VITNLSIGHYGRLGNQIFQYALLKAVSYKNNYKVYLPKENTEEKITGRYNPAIGKYDSYKLDLFDCFQIKEELVPKHELSKMVKHLHNEKFMHFDPSVFNASDDTSFHGYFQCADYFYDYEEKLKKDLIFSTTLLEKSNTLIDKIKVKTGADLITCVHVRRGDGVPDNGQYQVLLNEEYYKKLFKKYKTKSNIFLIISDDTKWCKEKFSDSDIYFLEDFKEIKSETDHLLDFCILSSGHSLIMANSSYSWWAAWLSKTNNVYCPSRWWGWANSHFSEENLRHKKWAIEQI